MTIDKNNRDIAYKYAWDWFEYHAKQRLTTFNFLLIILGALGYGYWAFRDNKEISFAIGIFGVIVSFAFLILEIRNTLLVDDGRQALDRLEGARNGKGFEPFDKLGIRKEDLKRIGLIKEDKGKGGWCQRTYFLFCSHNLCLRSILSAAIALSAIAAVNAKWGLTSLSVGIIIGLSIIILIISIWQRILKPTFCGWDYLKE